MITIIRISNAVLKFDNKSRVRYKIKHSSGFYVGQKNLKRRFGVH